MTKAPRTALLTGGLGYIGSHTAVALHEAGWRVVLLDNLANASRAVHPRLEEITGAKLPFYEADVRNQSALEAILRDEGVDAVIHLAGLKAVGASSADPLSYFENNVGGAVALLKAMQAQGVRQLVFSSSATVYGIPKYLPYDEAHPTAAINPYGRTKLHIEELLQDLAASDDRWRMVALRYFNPVGAHGSGLLGDDPNGTPNNLMPYVMRVAAGQLDTLSVFGTDYDTRDGTGVRDYLHVVDLAEGHVAALNALQPGRSLGGRAFEVVNLGSGVGHSVLELIEAFERVSGRPVPWKAAPRRAGDLPEYFAHPAKAKALLGWEAKRSLEEMCASSWAFQSRQTEGTAEKEP